MSGLLKTFISYWAAHESYAHSRTTFHLYATCTSSIMRLICPPKILHNLCFSFLLGITAFPREMENNAYAKFWGANKVHFGRCTSGVCLKKTKWRMELPGGFACHIPPSMGQFFAGRGRVISGHLANWFGNRFGTNTKLLRGVIGPI